ncbi:MAG TPA: SDR family NAD(P)-dependent oxidoreductase [Anaerolineae bacterium]|nr:SDR family NAD(P)-dependent oxidoreductase [Anaerolineae bacterium]
MKILVTGAAGFIGSHLTDKLIQRGHTVVGIDNFNDYYDPAKKEHNIAHLATNDAFRLIRGDIRDRDAILNLFATENFDAVAHLAGMAGVRNAVKFPDLYVSVNINGSQNLMDGARAHQVGNFVFASTSSAYGNTQQIPFVETDPADRPLQPYAATKRAIEILGYTYHLLYQLNFTAVRFFTVYGPRNRPDMMAYLLANSITTGREIPLYNNGDMYRDWTYVGDITDGLVAALEKPLGYEILNLGRGEPVKLADFVEMLEDIAGGNANLRNQPKLKADSDYTYANIDKARQLLNYNPQTSVLEGVHHFWRWYKQTQLD